jgi:hypothetical protein
MAEDYLPNSTSAIAPLPREELKLIANLTKSSGVRLLLLIPKQSQTQ